MFSFTCRHGITDFSKLTSLSLTDCVEEFVSINDFFSFFTGSRSLGRPTKPGLGSKEVQFRRLVLDIPPRAQHGTHGVWRVLEGVRQGVGKFSLDAGTQANASW